MSKKRGEGKRYSNNHITRTPPNSRRRGVNSQRGEIYEQKKGGESQRDAKKLILGGGTCE